MTTVLVLVPAEGGLLAKGSRAACMLAGIWSLVGVRALVVVEVVPSKEATITFVCRTFVKTKRKMLTLGQCHVGYVSVRIASITDQTVWRPPRPTTLERWFARVDSNVALKVRAA